MCSSTPPEQVWCRFWNVEHQLACSAHTWGAETLRDSSLIRSRALMIMYGSYVFLVVLTVMEPSTRFSSQPMPCVFSVRVTAGQTSCRYFSRYFGKRHAKDDSSRSPPGLYSGLNESTFQWSMPS